MKSGIYKITSPTNKIYIGQSVNIIKRLNMYKNKNCKSQTKLWLSFNKHGVSTHNFEVIEYIEISLLNERERFWQDYYNSIKNGLNCRATRTNDKSGYISEETKNKLSIINTGKIISIEEMIKRKETIKKNKHTKPKPIFKDEYIRMLSIKLKKPIIQIDKHGTIIKEWDSALDAANILNIAATHISSCCRNKSKTAYGFIWKYNCYRKAV